MLILFESHRIFFHWLLIDFQYQSINCYRFDIDWHRFWLIDNFIDCVRREPQHSPLPPGHSLFGGQIPVPSSKKLFKCTTCETHWMGKCPIPGTFFFHCLTGQDCFQKICYKAKQKYMCVSGYRTVPKLWLLTLKFLEQEKYSFNLSEIFFVFWSSNHCYTALVSSRVPCEYIKNIQLLTVSQKKCESNKTQQNGLMKMVNATPCFEIIMHHQLLFC